MLAHHFSHYYSQRCQRINAISPSYWDCFKHFDSDIRSFPVINAAGQSPGACRAHRQLGIDYRSSRWAVSDSAELLNVECVVRWTDIYTFLRSFTILQKQGLMHTQIPPLTEHILENPPPHNNCHGCFWRASSWDLEVQLKRFAQYWANFSW